MESILFHTFWNIHEILLQDLQFFFFLLYLRCTFLQVQTGDVGTEDQCDIKGYDGDPGTRVHFSQIESQAGLGYKRP